VGFALDLWISHRIPLEWPRFAHKRGRYPFPTGQGGSTTSPPIYPGNSAPSGSPALRLVKEGYTVAARQRNEEILCRAAGFLPRSSISARTATFWPFGHRFSIVFRCFPRFGRSAAVFPTFRPCDHRFSRFGPANAVFAASWPICTVTYVIGVPGSRLPVLAVFPVSAVRPPFSRRLGRATTVFPASWPICTVTYVIGVTGSRFPVFPRFGRFSPVSAVRPPFSHVSALRMRFSPRLGRFAR